MKKTHDLAVKIGEYTTKDGKTKARWQNVGALLQDAEGRPAILLSKWFNPAGVIDAKGGESLLLSAFPPRDRTEEPAESPAASPEMQQRVRDAMARATKKVDDIPF